MDVGLAWKNEAELSLAARAFCEFGALAYPGPDPFISIEGSAVGLEQHREVCQSQEYQLCINSDFGPCA